MFIANVFATTNRMLSCPQWGDVPPRAWILFWSVAQFVGRRKFRTDWDGRRAAAGTPRQIDPEPISKLRLGVRRL